MVRAMTRACGGSLSSSAMTSTSTDEIRTKVKPVNPANRLGLDYEREAGRLGPPAAPIIDVHTHITGREAASIYQRVCEMYGVVRTYSMSRFEEAETIRDVLGDRIRFIAVPDYWSEENRLYNLGEGYARRIEEWHAIGARVAKFWTAPRSIDYERELAAPGFMRLDSPTKVASLGMIFMTHVADPDTWFATRYSDASIYGTKRSHYERFEQALERFTQPWIAAHMGGWPEDLEFLTGLLERHDNLSLDTSACKWMVRELSRHSRDDLLAFLKRFEGRILFGSDIVTTDDHLRPSGEDDELNRKASTPDEAFDLYASRYWALRTLFETDYEDESPIADPDLAMVDPDRYDRADAPTLRGKSLPRAILQSIYHDAPRALLDPLDRTEA